MIRKPGEPGGAVLLDQSGAGWCVGEWQGEVNTNERQSFGGPTGSTVYWRADRECHNLARSRHRHAGSGTAISEAAAAIGIRRKVRLGLGGVVHSRHRDGGVGSIASGRTHGTIERQRPIGDGKRQPDRPERQRQTANP